MILIHLCKLNLLCPELLDAVLSLLLQLFEFCFDFLVLFSDLIQFPVLLALLLLVFLVRDVDRLEHLLVHVREIALHLVVLKAAEDGVKFLLGDVANAESVLLYIRGLLAICGHRCGHLTISLPRRHHLLYLAITLSGRCIVQGLFA